MDRVEIEVFVAATQTGDPRAREHVGDWLFSTLGKHLGRWIPAEDIDEVRQRSCLFVFENLHKFEGRGPGSFDRWIRAIARFRAKKLWEARAGEASRLEALLAHEPQKSTLSLASKVTMIELEVQLGEHFEQLTDGEREALVWDFEELNDRQLAKNRGLTTQAIRMRRQRARERLAALTRLARRTPRPWLTRKSPEA